MITILNRREIFITRDINELNRVRGLLDSNKINHTVKTDSGANSGRYHGVPNIKTDSAYQYQVFVQKRDFKRAESIINSAGR